MEVIYLKVYSVPSVSRYHATRGEGAAFNSFYNHILD